MEEMQQQLRARFERGIEALLRPHQLAVLHVQSLLMWDSPIRSAVAMVAAVAGVLLVASSGVSLLSLSALLAAGLVLRDYSWRSGSDQDDVRVLTTTSEPHRRLRTPLSEVSSHLADWCGNAWFLYTAACRLREHHHGWFCAVASAAFLTLIAFSRTLSGAVGAAFIVVCLFSWPLFTLYDLLPRLYLYFEPMLARLEPLLKAGSAVNGCEAGSEEVGKAGSAAWHAETSGLEHAMRSQDVPALLSFTDGSGCDSANDCLSKVEMPSDRGLSSSSLLGSFMPDVSEMPSFEDSSYDSFAISSVMSPSSIMCTRNEPHAGYDGNPSEESDLTLSERSRLDVDEDRSNLCSGHRQAVDACFGLSHANCGACQVSGGQAVEPSKAVTVAPLAVTGSLFLPAAVIPRPGLGGVFDLHQLPSTLRAVAQTVLDKVSHIPAPSSLWHTLDNVNNAGLPVAPAEHVGEDLDFEFVTNEDFLDNGDEIKAGQR